MFCWCVVVPAAIRPALSGVAGLWCFPGWDGRAGLPSACGAPPHLSWPGRTGRPHERVWCATPGFCFAGVVVLLLVVPCSLVSVRFLALRWCVSLPAAVPFPPHPALPLVVFRPPLCFLVFPARRRVCPPPPQRYVLPGWLSPAPRLPLLPLCLVVALRCLAVCLCFLLPPQTRPPPGRVSWVLAPAARFPLSSCLFTGARAVCGTRLLLVALLGSSAPPTVVFFFCLMPSSFCFSIFVLLLPAGCFLAFAFAFCFLKKKKEKGARYQYKHRHGQLQQPCGSDVFLVVVHTAGVFSAVPPQGCSTRVMMYTGAG